MAAVSRSGRSRELKGSSEVGRCLAFRESVSLDKVVVIGEEVSFWVFGI